MLLNELPAHLNPEKLCRSASGLGTCLSGIIPLGKLNDLGDELKVQRAAPVNVSLTFSLDEEGICCIEGELAVELVLTCQRCMKPMNYALKSTFLVSPVVSDVEARQLPERYEALLTTDGEVILSQWIAEELHLALPFVPRHETPCISYGDNTISEQGEEAPKKSSPFTVLKGKPQN